MQSLVDDGEDHRLREADEEQAEPRRDDDLAKGQCASDVSRSGQKLLDEVVLLAGETRLVDLQQSAAQITTATKLSESRTATAPPPTDA